MTLARFPYVKTLEQFDFSFQPSIARKLVRELAGLSFVERAENLILLGPPGTGKTMLAVGLGIKALEAGHRATAPRARLREQAASSRAGREVSRPRSGGYGSS